MPVRWGAMAMSLCSSGRAGGLTACGRRSSASRGRSPTPRLRFPLNHKILWSPDPRHEMLGYYSTVVTPLSTVSRPPVRPGREPFAKVCTERSPGTGDRAGRPDRATASVRPWRAWWPSTPGPPGSGPWWSTRRGRWSTSPTGSSPSTSPAPAGSSTTPPRSGRPSGHPGRGAAAAGRRAGRWPRSASPTSARRWWPGTAERRAAPPGHRLAGPAHGRALRRAGSSRATCPWCGPAPASSSTRTSRPPSCAWLLAEGGVGRPAADLAPAWAPSTPGCCGS